MDGDREVEVANFKLFNIRHIAAMSVPQKLAVVIATSIVAGLLASASIYWKQYVGGGRYERNRAAKQVQRDSKSNAMRRFAIGAGITALVVGFGVFSTKPQS